MCYRQTDRQTNKQTDSSGYRVATATKNIEALFDPMNATSQSFNNSKARTVEFVQYLVIIRIIIIAGGLGIILKKSYWDIKRYIFVVLPLCMDLSI